MNPAAFHLLLALRDRERHGYGLMQAARELSGGRLTLGTATFYRYLARLIENGLVVEVEARPVGDDPRRGAYYRLTDAGRLALDAERARLRELLATADALAAADGNRR